MHNKVQGRGTLVALVTVCSFGLCSEPVSISDPVPKLTVRVYNTSELSAHMLGCALQRVQQTFEAAEIKIEWVSSTSATLYARSAPGSGATGQLVRLAILPESPLSSRLRSHQVFGATSAGSVYVFYGNLRQFARLCDVAEPDVLAVVLAHELAHAVGVDHLSHGLTRGLMSARFEPRDVVAFAQKLRFTPEESALIRVRLRSAVDRDYGTNHADSGVVRANLDRHFTP